MATFIGTAESDVLVGTFRRDELFGESGDDVLLGSRGPDVLDGGGDDDVLDGGVGGDRMTAGGGDDVIVASWGSDTVDGGPGSDLYIVHGRNRDTVTVSDGGGEADTLDFSRARRGGTIDLEAGATSEVDGRSVVISGAREVSLPLDFVLSQDLSGSFGDDVATVQDLAPRLFNAIRRFQADSEFAVTSFIDKPTSPFGGSADHEYETVLPLTDARGDFVAAIDGLTLGSGADFPESQLSALLQIAERPEEIGFRGGSKKVVFLTTDAAYHEAGDFSSAPANNGDAVLDGDPPGTGEDYPSVEQVAEALQDAGVIPIFAVTAGVTSTYDDLVEALGFGAVVDLSSDSSDIVRAIREGIREVSSADIENAIGTDSADLMRGNALDNVLEGRAGRDTIEGRDGADYLVGGDGPDRLFGNQGDDVIIGNSGSDRMRGDDGADVFVVTGPDGNDRILDYDHSEGDMMDLSALDIAFGDLAISGRAGGRHTAIDYGEGRLLLLDVSPDDIGVGDFIF